MTDSGTCVDKAIFTQNYILKFGTPYAEHTVAENSRMKTRGHKKEGKTQRKMDGWSKTEYD
jgi:hypothetical protein